MRTKLFRIRIRLLLTLIIPLMVVGGVLQAQEKVGVVTGSVTSKTGAPVAGVNVTLAGNTTGSTTDSQGQFRITNIKAGQQLLRFTHLGYAPAELPIQVVAGQTLHFKIELEANSYQLKEVTVTGNIFALEARRLPDVYQTYLLSGKKNEVITLSTTNANVAEKTGRQLFAKVPGVFVYDMDGSGNQLNIATRGLDPHRSWEYNIRQNGVITNSDMYGYPASHYSPPMESIEQIQLIRGTGSLQYGAQFGGLINYVTKQADTSKAFGFESFNSVGSFGLFSTYNAIGGKVGKFRYYAYYHKRTSDGYRDNARSDAHAQFVQLIYDFTPKLSLKAELGRSSYLYQIPGPLTDSMFHQNPRQSTRSRNYFKPDIYVPSLTLRWQLTDRTRLNWTTSAVLGARNSVMLDAFATVPDTIDRITNAYGPRQVDQDHFHSYTSELRLLYEYRAGKVKSTLAGGVQYLHNDLHRQQLGKGTTGSDFDLALTSPAWGRNLHFNTKNVAIFLENLFQVSPRLSVSPGIRYEHGVTDMSGSISYYDAQAVPNRIKHRFPLLGISSKYQLSPATHVYAGWSQSYRPVIFKDIIPASKYERADKNLKDAQGYNAEIGISGTLSDWLSYEVTLFQLRYNNRLGSLVLTDTDCSSYLYRTNIGNSRTRGVETYVEARMLKNWPVNVSVFTSTAYMDGIYQEAQVSTGSENQDISGNRLESAPNLITRNGLKALYRHPEGFAVSATLQFSYVSETFSDALNTHHPTANGARGLVPAYGLWDLNTTIHLASHYSLRAGINNLTNQQYFTKRPTFYPGPGIWPSDGRSVVLTLGIKL